MLMKLNGKSGHSGWYSKWGSNGKCNAKEKSWEVDQTTAQMHHYFKQRIISQRVKKYIWVTEGYDWAVSTTRYRWKEDFWWKPTRVSWLCELVQGIDGKVDSKS